MSGDALAATRYAVDELKRMTRDFECRAALYRNDVSWIERAIAAEAQLAGRSGPVAVAAARNKHPAIIAAEASALFGGFLEQEHARLAEKARLMELDAFDPASAAADSEWAERNRSLGLRAVEREDGACQQSRLLQNAGFDGLFTKAEDA